MKVHMFDGLTFCTGVSLLLMMAPPSVFVSSAPLPLEVLINRDTRECTITPFNGDECAYCFIRQGWQSLGYEYLGITCPEGYQDLDYADTASFCVASRGVLCCSSGLSGQGDCNFLAFNENEGKCTITLCMDLPDGWTRDSPPEGDGRCPYRESDTWVDSNELDCDDPCKAALSCSDCIDTGCTWSFANEICSPACTDSETCIAAPLSDVGITSSELCQETESVLLDNAECEGEESCADCLSTMLPSDDRTSCRWVDTCDDSWCKPCLASACSSGSCDNALTECESTEPTCVDITFEKDADGNTLMPGKCLQDEWALYGLTLAASGGEGSLPCVFDTTNPVTGSHGDFDLGSPNQDCPNGGPGIGVGGRPDGLGPNCDSLGNVIIIQEKGTDGIPDDNATGGTITFTFSPLAEHVKEIGFLDVDEATTVSVVHIMDDNGMSGQKTINVPNKGNNSYQVVPIDTLQVSQLIVETTGSVAVSFISFCYL